MAWRDATARRAGRGDAASPTSRGGGPSVRRAADPPETRGCGAPRSPRGRGIDAARREPDHRRMLIDDPLPRSPRRSTAPSSSPATPAGTTPAPAFNLLLDQHPAAVAFPADAARRRRAPSPTPAPPGCASRRRRPRHNQGPLGDARGHAAAQRQPRCRRSASIPAPGACASAPASSGTASRRACPPTASRACTAPRPTSGIAGYSLGGGIGWLARKYGLQANAVTALELVTADGELVRADAENHPDLFWALRGGGGNFGVVTAIEFDVHEVDELYAGALFFPFERSAEVLHTWNALLPTLPDELMSWASVHALPADPRRAGVRPRALVRRRDGRVPRQRGRGPRAAAAAARARRRARHVRDGAAGGARRPGHGPARPGAVPHHATAARRAAGARRSTS